jgi:hypothetical protein
VDSVAILLTALFFSETSILRKNGFVSHCALPLLYFQVVAPVVAKAEKKSGAQNFGPFRVGTTAV